MDKYITTMRVRMGRKPEDLKPAGTPLELEDRVAAPLVRRKAIVPVEDIEGALEASVTTTSGVTVPILRDEGSADTGAKLAAIDPKLIEAIKALGEGDFAKDTGVPNLGPLRKALDRKVTAEERDDAWAMIEAEAKA